MDNAFSLNSFNVFQDEDNYYFFRALNKRDSECIKTGRTINEKGNITKIITDREYYGPRKDLRYTAESEITLREAIDHIKMHYDKHTNCISLTSNANTALTYGRDFYDDTYVIVKVPKSNMNKDVFQAGLYILKEVNSIINNKINNQELSNDQIELFRKIDSVQTQEELDSIKKQFLIDDKSEESSYVGGLKKVTSSVNYLSLNDEQNLIKNKTVLKIDLIKENLVKGVSNKLLIQTIGNAFSSLEMIHYKEVNDKEIISVPTELMDIFGIIQQLPNSLPNCEKFKQHFLSKSQQIQVEGTYTYADLNLDDELFSLDNIYKLTSGNVGYGIACNLYDKAFYFAKAKLRMINSLKLMKQILGDEEEYQEIYNYIENNTYGIEPQITTRTSKNKIQVSESVSLDFSQSEIKLFNYLRKLQLGQLKYIMHNPNETLRVLISNFVEDEMYTASFSKERWYASSIVDMLDLKRLGVESNLSPTQRNDLIDKLLENNCYEKYLYLKASHYKNEQIANIIITNIIRKNDNVDLKNLFTLEELEDFIGYNRIKGTGLTLRTYQKPIVNNIEEAFKHRQFTSAVLPTGAGKSFIALAEMYKHKNEKILYLAPNVEILNQIKKYIRDIYRPEEHIGDREDDPIKRMFPNIIFDTYQHLKEDSAKNIIQDQHSLIIFDELHRTGASEWQKQVKELLDNQNDKVRVLGITATPERDCDLKKMTDYWAQYYGYTREEIIKGKHVSANITLVDAIRLGYVINPKIVNCDYSLVTSGDLDKLKVSINDIVDEKIRNEELEKYNYLRKNVEKSDGIEKVLSNNVDSSGKYIVFLPVNKKQDGTYEDQDGNKVDKTTAERIVHSYQTLIKQYLFSNEYFETNGVMINNIYNKIIQGLSLSTEEEKYLNDEKENILLLSQIDVTNKPSSLNTKNNIIVNQIISYCNWTKYTTIELTKKINHKMRDKVEDYSMLCSYSNAKNKANLDSFNNNKSSKLKLMFVMNKLNEGIHVNNVDGIIWLRPLDVNSRILYLQQLGRCIYSINPNIDYDDNKRPLVIDLVNNTLKVKMTKDRLQEEIDLDSLLLISSWIESNDRYPEYDSYDKIERTHALTLNGLVKKYYKYYQNPSLIMEKSVESQLLIEEIIKVGIDLDIWEQPIVELQKNDNNNEYNSENIVDDNLFLGYLKLKETIRDFVTLDNEIKKQNNMDLRNIKIHEIYERYHNAGIRLSTHLMDVFKIDGTIIGNFLGTQKDYIKEQADADNKEAKWIISNQYDMTNLKIQEIYERFHDKNIIFTRRFKEKFIVDNTSIGSFIVYYRDFIEKEAKNGNEAAQWIINQLNINKRKIQEIYERYHDKNKVFRQKMEDKFIIDGTFIGGFIYSNRDYIEEEAQQGNEAAKWIIKQLDVKQLKLKEIYDKYHDKNISVNTKTKDRFDIDGTTIGFFIQLNKDYIEEEAKNGNIEAKWIYDQLNFDIRLVKIQEIYKRYHDNNKTVNGDSKDTFDIDGKIIGSFIKNNKKFIMEEAKNGNEAAQWIVKQLKWLVNPKDKIREIYDKYHDKNIVVNTTTKDKFDIDGTTIGSFFTNKNNMDFLKEEAKNGNEEAKWIVKQLKWLVNPKDKIQEIYKRYHDKDIVVNTTTKDSFDVDGTVIGSFIAGHRDFIKEEAKNGNKEAKWIIDQLDFDIRLVKIQEIYDKYHNSNIMLNRRLSDKFDVDGTVIGNFFGNKKNIDFTEEQAQQGKKSAQWIIEKLNENKEKYRKAKNDFDTTSNFNNVVNLERLKENDTGVYKSS